MRRLPVYVVVETSNEMQGEGIIAANHAVHSLISDLKTDPNALEVTHISLITFAERADQICALTELFEFQEPVIAADHGPPNLSLALSKLADCIDREVVPTTSTSKGDYRPIVFLISTGLPSPGSQEIVDEIKSRHLCHLIGLQSPTTKGSILREISESMVDLCNIQPGGLKSFFRWTSVAIGVSSLEVETNKPVYLPAPPPIMQIINTEVTAGQRGNFSGSLRMLLEKGADLNARSKDGETPLHSAVRSGNRDGVEFLIANAAALDFANKDGDTPLLLAVKLGLDEIAALLIKSGADVNAQDRRGLTALHYAVERNVAAPNSSKEVTDQIDLPPPPQTIAFVP